MIEQTSCKIPTGGVIKVSHKLIILPSSVLSYLLKKKLQRLCQNCRKAFGVIAGCSRRYCLPLLSRRRYYTLSSKPQTFSKRVFCHTASPLKGLKGFLNSIFDIIDWNLIINFCLPTSDQLFNLSSKTKPFVPSLLHTYIVHTFLSNPHLLNTSGERGKRGGGRERGVRGR